MPTPLLELAYRLTQAGEPFVLATVVACERPTSAKPGAQAIVQCDGQLTGWIGGNCAQPVVVREATRLLREGGDPYLLRLGVSPQQPDDGHGEIRYFPMSCSSGGVLDIFIEPHLPQPLLLLIGNSPVIHALSQIAPTLNFSVTQLDHPDLSQVRINEQSAILIATHGQYDEDALLQALPSAATYVGMVGSQRRVASILSYLRESGLSEQQIARLKAPAGLDIGAVTPEEIAASILAELIQARRRGLPDSTRSPEQPAEASEKAQATAIDPVCGMTVEISGARNHTHYDGQEFYFCCPACKRLFERNPQEYLVQTQ